MHVVLKMDNLPDIFWHGELITLSSESLFILRSLCICLHLRSAYEVETRCIIGCKTLQYTSSSLSFSLCTIHMYIVQVHYIVQTHFRRNTCTVYCSQANGS